MRAPVLGLLCVWSLLAVAGCSTSTSSVVAAPDAAAADGAVAAGEGPPDASVALVAKELAKSKGLGRCLAADAAAVYACDDANLVRFEIATAKASTLWTAPGGTMRGVEIIDGDVFATDGDSVKQVFADGSAPKSLLGVVKIKGNQYQATWRLGSSGSSLFVYDDASLVQFNRDGSGTPVRTRVENFFYLFPAGPNLWLVSHFDDFTIRVVPASAPKSTLANLMMSDAASAREHGEILAGTKDFVFSSEDSGGETSLIRYDNPSSAGAPERKELGRLPGSVTAMAADEANLFVSAAGALYRYTLAGTDEKELVAASISGPVALNESYAFVVDATDTLASLRAIPRE